MGAQRSQTDSYALSGSPPTSTTLATLVTALRAAANDAYGVDCTHSDGVNAVLSVDSDKTIVSGTLRCYCLMAVLTGTDRAVTARRWVYVPGNDITLTGGSTERDEATGDRATPAGAYRVAYLPDAVIGSTGATVAKVTHSVRIRST